MSFSAKVIKHSIALNGRQAVSMVVTMPQMMEQEFLRHRVFCCSFSSTRAIPMKRQLQAVLDNPFIPLSWGKAGKGMQAKEELTPQEAETAKRIWLKNRNFTIAMTKQLCGMQVHTVNDDTLLKVHKQIAGRLLQPFAWRTGVITATDWFNFFALRVHPDAQPEIQYFAYLCLKAYLASTPTLLQPGKWHLPFVTDYEKQHYSQENACCLISAARCARVSYNRLPTPEEIDTAFTSEYYAPVIADDIKRAEDLRDGSGGIGHWSPFEHQLQARGQNEEFTKSGPMHGFTTFRSMIDTGANIEDDMERYKLKSLLQQYEEMNPERVVR